MQRDLAWLSRQTYDLLVIGGGIYGAWTAWDATLRGLSVALVEKGDFGHATSANTLRVIHGGFRYLQHGDIRRMRRSMRERMALMRVAPHLVHPLPFLLPTYGRWLRGKEILSLALLMNDLIGFDRNRLEDPQKHLPRGRVISRAECMRLFPGVEEKGLTGGAICYDCQVYNSERLVISILRSAARAGAVVTNYVEATGPLREKGQLAVITAKDTLTGNQLEIRAHVVMNASGPWLERVLRMLNGHRPNWAPALSKAFNVLVNRQLVPQYAVGVYSTGRFADQDAILRKGARLFFITPWHNRSLIGTAHLAYGAEPEHFQVTEEEVQAFLGEINEAYPAAGLKRQDICYVYGGLLPAAHSPTDDVQLTKHHRIYDHRQDDGLEKLISVVGVKFTEARYVAERAVDLVFRKLGMPPPKSTTAVTALYGGTIDRFTAFLAREKHRRSRELGAEMIQRLIYHYGSTYPEVLKYCDNDTGLSQRSTDVSPLLQAEVLYGVREEMAQKLTDAVFRRSTLSLSSLSGNFGEACLRACALLMAKELGWNEVRTSKEIEEVRAVSSLRACATTEAA